MPDFEPKGPSSATVARNTQALKQLPIDLEQEREAAARGLVARPSDPLIRNRSGDVIWDLSALGGVGYGDAPATVHPGLWSQGQLDAGAGLFEVAQGVFQVRGYDIANLTLIEGERGVIVVDTLVSVECAAAALALYREHRGERPVTAVLYSHSHIDHFGGALGVIDPARVTAGEVPVVAPVGFLEHAVGENVIAGQAMARRAQYMFGVVLEPGPLGRVGAGIGAGGSGGTTSLVPPTVSVTQTGEELVLDGVRFIFQLVPETEAPAELTFLLPDRRALYIADLAVHAQHNLLTPRGAQVRDGLAWAQYLGEALELFGAGSDVLFGGHQWPVWGAEEVSTYLRRQRDSYRYLHDQSVRLMNSGAVAAEVAEQLELPESLTQYSSYRPYYGDVRFNARAVVQRYVGAYDGNPVRLDPFGPVQEGQRYVEAIGGAAATLEQARTALAAGDERWAATLASHVVFAGGELVDVARALEADALEQLGYQAENATWRNIYLGGARELREGVVERGRIGSPAIIRALEFGTLLDALAVRVDGPRAAQTEIRINFDLTDVNEQWLLRLEHGAFSTVANRNDDAAHTTLRVTRETFNQIIIGETTAVEALGAGKLVIEGDGVKVVELFGLLDQGTPDFAIVTP